MRRLFILIFIWLSVIGFFYVDNKIKPKIVEKIVEKTIYASTTVLGLEIKRIEHSDLEESKQVRNFDAKKHIIYQISGNDNNLSITRSRKNRKNFYLLVELPEVEEEKEKEKEKEKEEKEKGEEIK